MHSLHALALMHEKRMARLGSRCTRIQRRPSSTVWPASNGTSYCAKRPVSPAAPRQILSLACNVDLLAGKANRLVLLPRFARLAEIVALMRAAALLAHERGPGDAFGDQTHAAQVAKIDPLGVEPGARGAELRAER